MFYKLSSLNRYNNKIKIKSENLAEHQYFCALILLRLKPHLSISTEDFNTVLQYILIHDIGELYSGDVPHNVKAADDKIREYFDNLEETYIRSVGFGEIVDNITVNKKLFDLFKFCDNIQVVQYVMNENRLGNHTDEMTVIYNSSIIRSYDNANSLKESEILHEDFDLDEFIKSL